MKSEKQKDSDGTLVLKHWKIHKMGRIPTNESHISDRDAT